MIDVTIGRGNYQVVISDESGRLRKGGGREEGVDSCGAFRWKKGFHP